MCVNLFMHDMFVYVGGGGVFFGNCVKVCCL